MKIQKLTNNRLYYSEDEFYRVNIDIITEFQLKKNMIIDGQTEKKLLIELLLFRAYGFLIKRDYTEKEIRNNYLWFNKKSKNYCFVNFNFFNFRFLYGKLYKC